MAISTLKGVNKWTELASSTISGTPTSVSFTSISSIYSKLLINWQKVLMDSTPATVGIRFNNDSGSNYAFTYSYFSSNIYYLTGNGDDTRIGTGQFDQVNESTGFLLIENANDIYKKITYANNNGSATNLAFQGQGNWINATAIDRIDLVSTANFGSGTVKLYGSN